MIDQYLDGLDVQAEEDQKALMEFFGYDLELFQQAENENQN